MTAKSIVANLIARLRAHEERWTDADRETIAEAIAWLKEEDAASGGALKLNWGGVCDNCGLPALAHVEERCPTDAEEQAIRPVIEAWQAIVEPARLAYREARERAKTGRRQARRGRIPEADAQAHDREADRLWGDYQAAIRRADREAVE